MSIISLPFDVIKLFDQLLPQSDHINFLLSNSYFTTALGKEWNRARIDPKFCLERGYKQLSWLHCIPDNSSEIFWIFEDKKSFLDFSKKFLSYPYRTPEAVEYYGEVDTEVMKYAEVWLQLEDLKYFSLIRKEDNLDYKVILRWYRERVGVGWGWSKKKKVKERIEELNLEKLIWMDLEETISEFELGDLGSFTPSWLENHRVFNVEERIRLKKSLLLNKVKEEFNDSLDNDTIKSIIRILSKEKTF